MKSSSGGGKPTKRKQVQNPKKEEPKFTKIALEGENWDEDAVKKRQQQSQGTKDDDEFKKKKFEDVMDQIVPAQQEEEIKVPYFFQLVICTAIMFGVPLSTLFTVDWYLNS